VIQNDAYLDADTAPSEMVKLSNRAQLENAMDLQQEVSRLLHFVTGLSQLCPELWKTVDEMRERPDWPNWCFLPTGELCRQFREMRVHSNSASSLNAIGANLNKIAALAGWRVTQGVYTFDPDLFDCVWHTPLDTQIPGEALLRLPEWCVYIMTPGSVFAELSLRGFFAHLDYDACNRRTELKVLLDLGEDHLFSVLPIDLGARSLLDGLETSRERLRGIVTLAERQSEMPGLGAIDMRQYAGMLGSLINLLLYISSANAETLDASGRKPGRPSPKTTRKGPRLFPPDKPTEWQVGYRLGVALRSAVSRSDQLADDHDGPEQRARPRPHIRRAHWHSYWTGHVSSLDQRRLSVKWIPPIAVNVGEDHRLVPVVRSVTVPVAPLADGKKAGVMTFGVLDHEGGSSPRALAPELIQRTLVLDQPPKRKNVSLGIHH